MSRRPSAPRPKRGGEEFTRTHRQNDTDAPSSKRLRFDVRNPSALAPDAAEEDALLDADEIGRRGQAAKRNAVNIDGYDSDSSDDGVDARAEAQAKGRAAQGERGKKANGAGASSRMEEENDMFADVEEAMEGGGDGDDDEEVTVEGKKRKKEVRFIDENQIEGQVLNSKSGGHVSADFSVGDQGMVNGRSKAESSAEESSSDSDVDDETRADVGEADEEIGAGGKKEHAPRLDAFNMKNENEEGRFDEQGTFIRKAVDADAVHDSWLEGVSRKDIRRAKEANDQRNEELRLKRMADDKMLTSDILKTLIPHLEKGETVLEALARLGKRGKKEKPKWQKGRRKGYDEMDVDKVEEPKEARRREAIEAVTGAADQLLTRGQAEIYDFERELLTRQYTRETGEQWVDSPQIDDDNGDAQDLLEQESKQWEYRWSDARDGGELHGPYDGKMMKVWVDAGYFGDGIEYREAGTKSWTKNAGFL